MGILINGKIYEVVDGNYYLVATYGLAADKSDHLLYDTKNKLLTKKYVPYTGCKIVSNPILNYTDTMCVLYEDL